jgi:hypothetical protein
MDEMTRKVAIHEAGHVVVAWKHGWSVERVWLAEDVLNDNSEVKLADEYEPDYVLGSVYSDTETVEKYQTYYAAGAAAEKLIEGDYRPPAMIGDWSVIKMMEELKRSHADAEMDADFDANAIFETYVERASRLLERHVLQIETISQALAQQRSLSGERLHAMRD